MTRLIITLTPASECLELRGTEKDSRDYSYPKVRFQLMYHRRVHSRLVPAVGKSEDLLVERHDVQDRLFLAPSANRSSFTGILCDRIHILGGADICCRFVGDEQGCRASSDKNQFT